MRNRRTAALCLMCALVALAAVGCSAGAAEPSAGTLSAQEEKEQLPQESGQSEETADEKTAKFQGGGT